MMLVVGVDMIVLDPTCSCVLVARVQQNGNAGEHQDAGRAMRDRRPIAENRHRQDGPRERRRREVRGLTRRPRETQGVHVEEHAQPVAEGSKQHRPADRGDRGVESSRDPGDREQACPRSQGLEPHDRDGSRSDSLCVRLLSIAQQAHAPASASAPRHCPAPGPDPPARVPAPRKIRMEPSRAWRSRCSRKTTTARSAVRGPSRLSSRDPVMPETRSSPRSIRTGPRIPPVATTARSVGRSETRRRASRPASAPRNGRPRIVRAMPAPVYSSPARRIGPAPGRRALASGALAPNRSAAESPKNAPRRASVGGTSYPAWGIRLIACPIPSVHRDHGPKDIKSLARRLRDCARQGHAVLFPDADGPPIELAGGGCGCAPLPRCSSWPPSRSSPRCSCFARMAIGTRRWSR